VKLINLSGQRFGHLVVLNRAADEGREAVWFCHCDCGKSHRVRGGDLRNGHTVSCGCIDGTPASRTTHERSLTVEIEVDREVVVRLRPAAAKRDMPVTRLIHDLLDVIAADQLVTAVLDDAEA
jgi:hypothetical protein